MTHSPPRRQSRRVLITGVTGIIARQLAEELLLDPLIEKVVGVDIGEEPYYFRDLDRRRFLFKRANILKGRELQNLFLSEDFRNAKVDTVVHAMFIESPQQARQYGVSPVSINVQGTRQLLDRCEALEHIRNFIFMSSWSVYRFQPGAHAHIDERAELNFDPNAPRLVQDQVDADMICRAQMDAPGLDVTIVRPGPIIGRNIESPLNRLLESSFCPVPMGFDPMINPIHARDVVRALHGLVDAPIKGIFNIAGKDIAPLSFFTRMAHCHSVRLPTPLLAPATRVMRRLRLTRFDERSGTDQLKYGCLLDTRRAQKELAFEPKFHIKF